jgi:hypothetical protein
VARENLRTASRTTCRRRLLRTLLGRCGARRPLRERAEHPNSRTIRQPRGGLGGPRRLHKRAGRQHLGGFGAHRLLRVRPGRPNARTSRPYPGGIARVLLNESQRDEVPLHDVLQVLAATVPGDLLATSAINSSKQLALHVRNWLLCDKRAKACRPNTAMQCESTSQHIGRTAQPTSQMLRNDTT